MYKVLGTYIINVYNFNLYLCIGNKELLSFKVIQFIFQSISSK
jgi:hypothetical protein